MLWKPMIKLGTFVAWAVGLLGGLLGLYAFYAEYLRQDPMFDFIGSQIVSDQRADRTGRQVPHQRLELVFRFTNTNDEPVSPRSIAFHDVEGQSVHNGVMSRCVLGGPDLPPVFEPGETARTSCATAWVAVPPLAEGASIFTQSPLQQAAVRICSVRVGLSGDNNRDELVRAFEYGGQDHRQANC